MQGLSIYHRMQLAAILVSTGPVSFASQAFTCFACKYVIGESIYLFADSYNVFLPYPAFFRNFDTGGRAPFLFRVYGDHHGRARPVFVQPQVRKAAGSLRRQGLHGGYVHDAVAAEGLLNVPVGGELIGQLL